MTKRLAAEMKLAETKMNQSFDQISKQKRVYDIVCAVSVGNLTEDQAKEEIRLLNIDE